MSRIDGLVRAGELGVQIIRNLREQVVGELDRKGGGEEAAGDADQAKARLAAIVESSGDAMIGMTLAGEITTWNRGAEELFGCAAAEAVGKPVWLVVPQDRPGELATIVDRVGAGEPIDAIETQRVRADGRRLDISLAMSPIRDGSDKIVGASAVARDITKRRRPERYRELQLAVAQALAESLTVEAAMPGILETLGRRLNWEAGAYWAHGLDRELLLCGAFWHLPEREVGTFEDAVRATSFSPGEGLPGRAVANAGSVWVDRDFSELEDGPRVMAAERAGLGGAIALPLVREGQVNGVIELFGADPRPPDDELLEAISVISGQVAQFVTRKEAEDELESLKDEFFGLVSHELRTPLTSVVGYTEMLAKTESQHLTDRGNKFLDVIRRNAMREMRLVGDLLMLVRVEAGTFELQPGMVELHKVVNESVEAARPAARAAALTLSVEAAELPETEGDADRLGQALDNLLSNAIKFTPAGGSVQVRLIAAGQRALIEVQDSGPGILPEDQERLFDRLYRAPTASQNQVPGSGLGLTVVKAIVDAHEGRVEMQSEVGVGTTFRVELPLREGAESGNGRAPIAKQASR